MHAAFATCTCLSVLATSELTSIRTWLYYKTLENDSRMGKERQIEMLVRLPQAIQKSMQAKVSLPTPEARDLFPTLLVFRKTKVQYLLISHICL